MRRKIYIAIFSISILLATATGIFEHYRLNKDNLVQYFPEDSVVYIHARLHTDQIISNAFDRFVKSHSEFSTTLYPQLEEYLAIWPKFDPVLVEEVSFGVVKNKENFVPLLAVFVRDEDNVNNLKEDWEDQGYFVKQRDMILLVSKNKDVLDQNNSLQDLFKKNRRPMSNAWYIYIDLVKSRQWFEQQDKFSQISAIFDEIATNQSSIFASISFRDDLLIITEDIRKLKSNNRHFQDWKLKFLGQKVFIANDIVYFSEFLQKITTAIDRVSPDTKKKPGLVNRFVIEQFVLGDILQKTGLSPNISAIIKQQTDIPDVVIELGKTKNFDREEFFNIVKQLASYDYPSQKRTRLKDGTYITELVAKSDAQIIIKQEKYPAGVLFTVVSNENEWEYFLLETTDSIFVFTNKDLIDFIFVEDVNVVDGNICLYGNSSYIYNNLAYVVNGEVGNDEYVFNLEPNAITFCLR